MKDYYKIGEISKIYGIGRDSLMYYEKIGILKPIRDENKYRLYSIGDIWKLNLIKELRELNFPMQKIKDYIDNRTIDATKDMLIEAIDLLDMKIQKLNIQKKNIKERLESIEEVVTYSKVYEMDVVYMEQRKILELNGDISRDEDVDFLVKKLQKQQEKRFYILGNNNIGAIYNLDKINNNIFNEYKSVFCLVEDDDESYDLILNAGYYVTYSYRGRYKDNEIYIPKILEFIEKNNYSIVNNPIEIYKVDVHETALEQEFITQIQVPVILNKE